MYKVNFLVTGKGHFPFDMLRYDRCHPASPSAVTDMTSTHPEIHGKARTILLQSFAATKQAAERMVTGARWASFGWKAHGIEIEKV